MQALPQQLKSSVCITSLCSVNATHGLRPLLLLVVNKNYLCDVSNDF